MKKTHCQILVGATISLLLLISISGCQLAGVPVVTAMHVANVADQHAAGKRAEKLWDQQLAEMREMQARGDPMGDYLYALGNAQGWIKDTSDPLKIRDLLAKAAQEGSSDAKIVLGIYYFVGAIPHQGTRSIWLPDSLRDHQHGLQLIREGMQARCTYGEPVVSAYGNRAYLRYISAASRIWPYFRDGQYRKEANGNYITILDKDPRLEKEWRDLDSKCLASGATSE
ncbi:hypothetical protein [Paraburkholderia antibiotica]|uniref:Sel1 repeat family protein n=1 Tax=Paraburkholderia antibiotica TaxID=2728839 RepID=A0A7X9X5E0_9BURK|nr:hypothetical protein [Paraburkholderia antibiotica]NML31740.1 hypothetical protein [Paraburkholderia antibiotica]